MTWRRAGRWLLYGVAGLTVLVAVVTLALSAWVRSERGRGWARDRLVGFINENIEGRLTIERISGPIYGAATLHGLVLADPSGRIVGRARAVHVAYRARGFATGHLRIERVVVEAADFLDLEALTDGRLGLKKLSELLKRRQKSFRIEALSLHDTRIAFGGVGGPLRVLDRLGIATRLWMVDHGRYGEIDLRALEARMTLSRSPRRPAEGSARLAWDPESRIIVKSLDARPGKSRIRLSGRLTGERVDADLDELTAAPRDLHQLYPLEDAPDTIRAQASLHGRFRDVMVRIDLQPGPGRVKLRGHGDWPRRTLAIRVDHHALDGAYFPTQPPLTFNGTVWVRARLSEKGLVGPGKVDGASGTVNGIPFTNASANGIVYGTHIEFARAALDVPGGSVSGHAHLDFAGPMRIGFRAHLTETSKVLALLRKKTPPPPSPPTGKSDFTVDGEFVKRGKKDKGNLNIHGIRLARPVARSAGGKPL